MGDYPWARLRPLPEVVVAWMTLRGLPGVESRLPIGWAQAGLMLATYVTAFRPGCELRMDRRSGGFVFETAGGTGLDRDDVPVGPQTSAWVISIASRTCELCARPARYRHDPPGSRCDVCESLRGSTNYTAGLPFEPRLPLTDEAEVAAAALANETDLAVPAGWAALVRKAIRDFRDASPESNYAMTDGHDHMGVYLLEGDEGTFAPFVEELKAATRRVCKHCGRSAQNKDHPGICDGCRAVQARDYKILSADKDGTDDY
jgi:hypothetical protein